MKSKKTEYEKAEAYLNQILILDSLIENKQVEADKYDAIAKQTTAVNEGDRVQVSSSKQRMANATTQKVFFTNQIEEHKAQKENIISIIDQVGEPKLIKILYKKYCQDKNWGTIAKEMNMSYNWVKELHKRALKIVAALMEQYQISVIENDT